MNPSLPRLICFILTTVSTRCLFNAAGHDQADLRRPSLNLIDPTGFAGEPDPIPLPRWEITGHCSFDDCPIKQVIIQGTKFFSPQGINDFARKVCGGSLSCSAAVRTSINIGLKDVVVVVTKVQNFDAFGAIYSITGGASLPTGLVNFTAGFGDSFFGISTLARSYFDIGSVDYNSGTYLSGQLAGYGTQLTATVFSGAAAMAESATVAGGDHIVLGLANFGLEDTAAQVGGRTLLSDAAWQKTLQTAIADPSTRFTLSLEGLSGTSTYSQVMSAAQRGIAGVGGYTDWEIGQLYQGGRLSSAGLYNGGRYIANPFGP